MARRSTLVFAIALAILFGGTVTAFSQVSASVAQLNGTVRDESAGTIANAPITLREEQTNRTYTAASNDAGLYVVPNLPPGRYELKVSFSGFANFTQTGIALRVGQTATVDVTLKIASLGEQVVVSTEAPVIEPTRTEMSQVIDTAQIDSLPISGRLFTDFALLTPGVSTGRSSLQSTITEFEVTRVSFGGMRDFSNIVTVDGADTINSVTASQRATPSQEAVSEFRVVNNSFGAEYGRALGGIVNIVTKSGTNKLHGSVYDYLQNDATDARSLLQAAPAANVLRQNQFGATLGGPIQKDRTFFFLNYEGQRRGESPTYPPALATDLKLINTAKQALGIPAENTNILKTKDSDNGFVRFDRQMNKNNNLTLRYSVFDARELNLLVGDTLDGGGIGTPSSGHNAFIRDQSLVGTLNTEIGSRLVNTMMAQFARRHYDFPGVTGEPNLDISNSLLLGHNFGVFDAVNETRAQFSDSLSWVKGNHVAKFGYDSNYLQDWVIWPGFTPMRIVLPGINCLVDFANYVKPSAKIASNFADGPCPLASAPYFPSTPGPNPNDPLNGTPIIFWGVPVGNGPVAAGSFPPAIPTDWKNAYLPSQTNNFVAAFNHAYQGLFLQDQWRINRRLTLNYGLRWDLETGLERQIKRDYRGFQPRFGLAYSPNNKTVIRAGFGIFDDRYNESFLFVTFPQRPAITPGVEIPGRRKGAETAPWFLNQLPFIPGLPAPADVAKQFVTTGTYGFPNNIVAPTFVGDGLVDSNSRIPYSEQASLEIDREIGRGLKISIGYMFVSAHKLVRAENLNVCPRAGAKSGPYSCAAASAPLPGWPSGKDNSSGVLWPAGLIYYTDNSGNSVYHGMTVQVSERAGNYLRLNANYTFSKTLDDGTFTTFVSTPQDLYHRGLERANSNQDLRHRFVSSFVANGPNKTFLRKMELSSIITAQSSRPFTMFVGFDANGDTNPVTDRVGNAPRNSYWGDIFVSFDVRLSRSFKIREGQKLDAAMDAFNLFNRTNVNEVNSVYGTYNFCSGQIPVSYKDSVSTSIQQVKVGGCPAAGPPVPNPLFGGPRTMFNPRQLQFSLKYSF
jgi:hypothetical protein